MLPTQPLIRVLLLAGLSLSMLPACAQQRAPDAAASSAPIATIPATPAPQLVTGLPDFTRLVEEVGPGVVNITATIGPRMARGQAMPQEQIPEIFRRMLPPGMFPDMPGPGSGPRGRSAGTGFIISADGYVLTNHHVVDNATEVKVTLTDRREFEATLVGSDAQSDVALLKIEAAGLPALRLGDSNTLKPGQWVVAIGSPFGLDQSVTAGVVSAVGRTQQNQQYVPFIQTDVAINRGNSGGPLLDTRGQVVGINSQIFSNTGGFMGVSFAIPIATAMNAAEQLKSSGRVSRGQLGVSVGEVTADMARGFNLPDTNGALVSDVLPGSAAERAGLERGDVIREVNGNPVTASSDLPPLIGAMAPGSRVQLTVLRDGRERQLTATLDELDAVAGAGASAAPTRPGERAGSDADANPLGIAVQELDAATRRAAGIGSDEGVRIVRITGEAAARADLRPGDIVLAVGRVDVGSVAAFNRALNATREGQTVMLLVRRGGGNAFIAVPR
ncbi:MAG: DegQ family serine endoprotease [Pseudoxanthomonas suwonensis]|nr:DegQ family serine endoprotease [Pseudoxanthomonas suwonensis]